MTATLERPVDVRPTRERSTVLVLDEYGGGSVESILAAFATIEGPVIIMVTSHPPPLCFIGANAGMEALLMWNECRSEHETNRKATARRVHEITDALRARGIGPIRRIDSLPAAKLFRRLVRREVDGALRDLRRIQPDRIVVDREHHLRDDLQASISRAGGVLAAAMLADDGGSRRGSPTMSPTVLCAGSERDEFAHLWVDLGGSE